MFLSLATSVVALAVFAAAAPQPSGHSGMAIPIQKRSQLMKRDKTIDPAALSKQVASARAKIHRGLQNYERNTGNSAPRKRGYGEPLRDDLYEDIWYGSIGVGTPPVIFTVHVDTGSSDLFVPASSCHTCGNHTRWNPKSSSTARNLNKKSGLSFGDHSTALVDEYTDTVTIGPYIATSQTLGAATHYSTLFSEVPSDGLMGLGFQSISVYNATPVFQTLVSKAHVEPAFSFKLSSSGGELYLGGSNHRLYTGNFTYTPVTDQMPGFWVVNMESVVGNGHEILTDVTAIIDTGTSFILAPPSDASKVCDAVGGKITVLNGFGMCGLPCESVSSVSLTFGGTSFPISNFNQGQIENGSSTCVGNILSLDLGGDFWVIGDRFLTNVYTQFDVGQKRVGFAQLA